MRGQDPATGVGGGGGFKSTGVPVVVVWADNRGAGAGVIVMIIHAMVNGHHRP